MNDQERRLLEDLKYTQTASLLSEQIYPYWENVFAVIVAASFYIYFQTPLPRSKILICVVAAIFSLGWFLLASRNYRFADARVKRLKRLEEALYNVIPEEDRTILVRGKTINLFRLYEFIGQEFGPNGQDENLYWWESCGTWTIRKGLPGILFTIWIFLLIFRL